MEKINITELLRNCPKGMELDCTMFENITFEEVVTEVDCDGNENISIVLATHHNDGMVDKIILTEYGTYTSDETAKCVIFPKGKTTWEGFVPPYKFKDGDVIITGKGRENECVAIFKSNRVYEGNNGFHYHSLLYLHTTKKVFKKDDWAAYINVRLATKEEKQKLFQAIKDNGYKWNAETKTLEKLIEPYFKVGDRIKHKTDKWQAKRTIQTYVSGIGYITTINDWVLLINQDNWELVPNKFDISTLKPFERVLGRDKNTDKWLINFWGFYNIDNAVNYPYECCGNSFAQCIPYEGNEHLRGTTNDCDDFYKTWEK